VASIGAKGEVSGVAALAVGVELVVELLLRGGRDVQSGVVVAGMAQRWPVGEVGVQDDEAGDGGRDGWRGRCHGSSVTAPVGAAPSRCSAVDKPGGLGTVPHTGAARPAWGRAAPAGLLLVAGRSRR